MEGSRVQGYELEQEERVKWQESGERRARRRGGSFAPVTGGRDRDTEAEPQRGEGHPHVAFHRPEHERRDAHA